MKKITLLLALLLGFVSYSQSNRQLIQSYLNANKAKLNLTSQDVSDWVISGELKGNGSGITTYHIVQRYQGIEIYDTQSSISVKNGILIKLGNKFNNNIASKITTTTPDLNVVQALSSAYVKLEIPNSANFSVTQNLDVNKFELTDGIQDEIINAKLVYQQTKDKKLKLAWAFQIHTPNGKSYWDLRIDASDGQILEKNDLVINCQFHKPNSENHKHQKGAFFQKNFYKTSFSPLEINAGSYKVIPYNYASPNHSTFQSIISPSNLLASPNGWHDSNNIGGTSAALKFNYTRGNNILAQEDANGDNGNGLRPDGTSALSFDFPYVNGVGQTLQPTDYTSAATTNLFYMSNIMHDVWYQYGFDEANGNYQQSNLGRQGTTGVNSATGDYVLADSQDGWSQTTPTLNNANFTPSNDGVRPRLQMFMWTIGAPPTDFITINSPSSISGPRAATTNVFDTTDRIPVPAAPNGIVADLVQFENALVQPTFSGHSACQPVTNPFDLDGKIVLVRRGGCFFSNKVKRAQDAGALAVIMMDSIPNNPTRLSMSSTGVLGINIPAVFVTKEIGDALVAELANGPVNAKLEVPAGLYLYADGDFDNGIVSHEYGHGISNRLVGGGLAGCMTNYDQMGEGWSDWFALMMQLKPGETGAEARSIATYAINEPNTGGGLRDFPYSTDMTINPRTYASTNSPIPTVATDTAYRYKIGEFWATVLWDLNWKYIQKYGYDDNIYTGIGGNNRFMRLVLDALKLETCNQTNIVTGRDNLLAADLATTGGIDHDMIANAFVIRGVGLNATAGNANDCSDQTEDFTPIPSNGLDTNNFDYNKQIRVYPNPSNGLYNVRINKFVGQVTIKVTDINGRVVYNQTDAKFNTEKTIDLSAFQSGIYVLKVSGNDLNYSEKLIKN
jgi:extracellular elastinolytic metalloproteinase